MLVAFASQFSLVSLADVNTSASDSSSATHSCQQAGAGSPPFGRQFTPGSASTYPRLSHHVAEGIDVISGNMHRHELDYRSFKSGLSFVRHYNSLLSHCDEGFGGGWRHSFQLSLHVDDSGDQVFIQQGDGRLIQFVKDISEGSPNRYRAIQASDGYLDLSERSVWHLFDGRRMSFQHGRLVEMELGEFLGHLSLDYQDGKLVSVTDDRGDAIRFNYVKLQWPVVESNANSSKLAVIDRLNSVILPNGSFIEYQYNASAQLLGARYPEGESVDYRYAAAGPLEKLVSRVNSREKLLTEWQYDNHGHVIEQQVRGRNQLRIARMEDNTSKVLPDQGTVEGRATVIYSDDRQEQYQWRVGGEESAGSVIDGNQRLTVSCEHCARSRFRSCTTDDADSDVHDENIANCFATDTNADYRSHYQDPSFEVMSQLWKSFSLVKDPETTQRGVYFRYRGQYPHEQGHFPFQVTVDRLGSIKNMIIGDLNYQQFAQQQMMFGMNPSLECDPKRGTMDSDNFIHNSLLSMGTGGESCPIDWMLGAQFLEMLESYANYGVVRF